MTTIFGKGQYCCICFTALKDEQCWKCPKCGTKWDVCGPGVGEECGAKEQWCPTCQPKGAKE